MIVTDGIPSSENFKVAASGWYAMDEENKRGEKTWVFCLSTKLERLKLRKGLEILETCNCLCISFNETTHLYYKLLHRQYMQNSTKSAIDTITWL